MYKSLQSLCTSQNKFLHPQTQDIVGISNCFVNDLIHQKNVNIPLSYQISEQKDSSILLKLLDAGLIFIWYFHLVFCDYTFALPICH